MTDAQDHSPHGVALRLVAVQQRIARPADGSQFPAEVGSVLQIAAAVAFLPSDGASCITGAHLAVDGGFLA
ncbi:SDR family oxidoreductase [Streptomyces atratus]|uniref:SDR family oxidoreductase n=1 Tax=Streptomyces atratus TaxID=1893 RepID=UPI00365174C0